MDALEPPDAGPAPVVAGNTTVRPQAPIPDVSPDAVSTAARPATTDEPVVDETTMSAPEAVTLAAVAAETGLSKNELYDAVLAARRS